MLLAFRPMKEINMRHIHYTITPTIAYNGVFDIQVTFVEQEGKAFKCILSWKTRSKRFHSTVNHLIIDYEITADDMLDAMDKIINYIRAEAKDASC